MVSGFSRVTLILDLDLVFPNSHKPEFLDSI